MDPETEWCDRYYQEHKRKANTDGRITWRGDVTIDGQSQNGYAVEIKDLEADQE